MIVNRCGIRNKLTSLVVCVGLAVRSLLECIIQEIVWTPLISVSCYDVAILIKYRLSNINKIKVIRNAKICVQTTIVSITYFLAIYIIIIVCTLRVYIIWNIAHSRAIDSSHHQEALCSRLIVRNILCCYTVSRRLIECDTCNVQIQITLHFYSTSSYIESINTLACSIINSITILRCYKTIECSVRAINSSVSYSLRNFEVSRNLIKNRIVLSTFGYDLNQIETAFMVGSYCLIAIIQCCDFGKSTICGIYRIKLSSSSI